MCTYVEVHVYAYTDKVHKYIEGCIYFGICTMQVRLYTCPTIEAYICAYVHALNDR